MTKDIRYYSTNHNSESVSFKEALMRGQAPDKGLYMPNCIPEIPLNIIKKMKEMPYHEIAFIITNQFLEEEIPENKLREITREIYNFDIPLELAEDRKYIMRLDQGPTASFKDFGAQMLARLMSYYTKSENKELIILTATSGDTGSAVANAFYNLDNIKMIVLFPEKEVSELQRKQMTTLGKNITAVAVDGKFDDCQAMVKQAFSDPELKLLNLSSANSINFGRLLPQIVYYFYAYSKLVNKEEKGEEVIFAVPSGNFGNLMAGLIAKKMGLPVYKFIAATNENDEFPKFLETEKYIPVQPSRACISSAMNVGHPSNLARIFDLYNGQMNEKGEINKMPNIDVMRKDIFSISISDNETRATIKNLYDKNKIILEPHGAVAWAGLEKFQRQELINESLIVSVSLETAHPAKFPEELQTILQVNPELPKSMLDLVNKKEVFEKIPADYKIFKKFIKNI